jgi:hypothetical protein
MALTTAELTLARKVAEEDNEIEIDICLELESSGDEMEDFQLTTELASQATALSCGMVKKIEWLDSVVICL